MPDHDQPAILITGAGRNVGAHMARRFLALGYPVIVHYRTHTDTVDELAGAGAQLVRADLTDPDGPQAIADAAGHHRAGLRAIIHNASAFGRTAAAPADAAAQLQTFFDVHMRAPFLLNRLLANHLSGTPDAPADIVHISDIYADNPAVEYDAYCATKAGLQNLALSAAKRLAPTVKVNAVQPGPISFQNWHSSVHQDSILKTTLLQRAGGPEALFIAIRAILDNPFQTGAIIAVDGGRRLA